MYGFLICINYNIFSHHFLLDCGRIAHVDRLGKARDVHRIVFNLGYYLRYLAFRLELMPS